MKTMKYRSIFAAFTAVALSVFLFTSCEKESDGEAERGNRLEKFKRLQFSTSGSASSSTNSGSGTFIGNGSNISYVPPGDAGSAQFAPAPSGNANGFTDPNSTGPNFVVDRSFGEGGGSVTIDGERIDMDYAFCAEADFLGFFDGDDDSTTVSGDGPELNLFVGIAGELDTEGEEDPMMDLVLYAFSYNGGQNIGSFLDFEGELSKRYKGAFVIAVAFEEDDQGDSEAVFYFGTEGSVAFAGSEVILSGVKMTKVEVGSDANGLTSEVVNLAANLTCVELPDDATED